MERGDERKRWRHAPHCGRCAPRKSGENHLDKAHARWITRAPRFARAAKTHPKIALRAWRGVSLQSGDMKKSDGRSHRRVSRSRGHVHRPPLRGFMKLCCVARRTRKTAATKVIGSRPRFAQSEITPVGSLHGVSKASPIDRKPNFRKLSFFVSTRQATWLVSTTLRSKLLEHTLKLHVPQSPF